MTSTPKRFIAGAVCPRCGEMDRIVTFRLENREFRECVSCDFKDEMIFKPAVRELETRVSREEEQPVKIVEPKDR